jgi:glycerol-3-phosphate acyltransferase PlsX
VALKTLEGAFKFVFSTILEVIGTNDETKGAGDVLLEYLLPVASRLTPESQGGAMLLGVNGICVISHGSSNATAMMNAIRVAAEASEEQIVAKLASTIRPDQVA